MNDTRNPDLVNEALLLAKPFSPLGPLEKVILP